MSPLIMAAVLGCWAAIDLPTAALELRASETICKDGYCIRVPVIAEVARPVAALAEKAVATAGRSVGIAKRAAAKGCRAASAVTKAATKPIKGLAKLRPIRRTATLTAGVRPARAVVRFAFGRHRRC